MSKQVWTADKLTAYYTTLADVSGAHMRRSVVRRVSVGSREIWRNNEWNTRYGQRGKGVSQPFRSRPPHSLNGRPRQALDGMTPSEKLAETLQWRPETTAVMCGLI